MAASNPMSSLSHACRVLNVLSNSLQPSAGFPNRYLDFSKMGCCQNTQLLLDLGKTLISFSRHPPVVGLFNKLDQLLRDIASLKNKKCVYFLPHLFP